jgi:hypothetical protein
LVNCGGREIRPGWDGEMGEDGDTVKDLRARAAFGEPTSGPDRHSHAEENSTKKVGG